MPSIFLNGLPTVDERTFGFSLDQTFKSAFKKVVVALLHRLHDGVLVYGANNFYMCKMPGGGRKKATS